MFCFGTCKCAGNVRGFRFLYGVRILAEHNTGFFQRSKNGVYRHQLEWTGLWTGRLLCYKTGNRLLCKAEFYIKWNVKDYLRETFRYAHVYKGKYVHLAKEPEEPFFLTHRWDSLESPAVLRMIAEKIRAGFDEIYPLCRRSDPDERGI